MVKGDIKNMARLRVREIAEAQGLDAAKLSRKADVPGTTMWKIWRDPEHNATVDVLKKIAIALGVKMSDLWEDENNKKTEQAKS